jgi:hypothetical protein
MHTGRDRDLCFSGKKHGDDAVNQSFAFEHPVELIEQTHRTLQQRAARFVDLLLMVRNSLFGRYIVGYEHNGVERAKYATTTLKPFPSGNGPFARSPDRSRDRSNCGLACACLYRHGRQACLPRCGAGRRRRLVRLRATPLFSLRGVGPTLRPVSPTG